jgi:uncharacterized protein (TIGR00106 family)
MPVVKIDVSLVPLGTGSTSLGDTIAEAEKVLLRYPSVEYHLNPMSTTLRGELSLLLEVVSAMHEAAFTGGVQRVVTSLKIDDRRDEDPLAEPLLAKMQRVKAKAGLQ